MTDPKVDYDDIAYNLYEDWKSSATEGERESYLEALSDDLALVEWLCKQVAVQEQQCIKLAEALESFDANDVWPSELRGAQRAAKDYRGKLGRKRP